MNKTTEAKKEFVTKLFSNRQLFEREILQIESENDRAEIMKFLAVSLVRETLKEELNFLCMKNFSDFTFAPIKNIIFKEIANEWLTYALEVLHYEREDALQELQEKKRVRLILSIINDYFQKYQNYFFEEIADTFIELVSRTQNSKNSSALIEGIISCDLIANEKLMSVDDFQELWKRVRIANSSKEVDINRIKIKIDEISTLLDEKELDTEKKASLWKSLKEYQSKVNKMMQAKLEKFDRTLKNIKDAM
ncbi:MAG: hypothetical protein Q7S59_05045, partial [Sulfurimonas sp.]|nr:hypothetical protein [Sulfurimonas sp.]